MAGVALATWFMAALVGFYMASLTLDLSRPVGEAANTHMSSLILFVHPSIAVAGAGVWIAYLVYHDGWLAWTGFAFLVVVATLGDMMLVGWLKTKKLEKQAADGGAVPMVSNLVPRLSQGRVQVEVPDQVPVTALVERRIPTIAVSTHGLLAVITIVLVLLCALGVGG